MYAPGDMSTPLATGLGAVPYMWAIMSQLPIALVHCLYNAVHAPHHCCIILYSSESVHVKWQMPALYKNCTCKLVLSSCAVAHVTSFGFLAAHSNTQTAATHRVAFLSYTYYVRLLYDLPTALAVPQAHAPGVRLTNPSRQPMSFKALPFLACILMNVPFPSCPLKL